MHPCNSQGLLVVFQVGLNQRKGDIPWLQLLTDGYSEHQNSAWVEVGFEQRGWVAHGWIQSCSCSNPLQTLNEHCHPLEAKGEGKVGDHHPSGSGGRQKGLHQPAGKPTQRVLSSLVLVFVSLLWTVTFLWRHMINQGFLQAPNAMGWLDKRWKGMLEVYGPVSARALQLYSNFQVWAKLPAVLISRKSSWSHCFKSKRRANKIAAIPQITVEVNRMWESSTNIAHGSRLKAKITPLPKLVSVLICVWCGLRDNKPRCYLQAGSISHPLIDRVTILLVPLLLWWLKNKYNPGRLLNGWGKNKSLKQLGFFATNFISVLKMFSGFFLISCVRLELNWSSSSNAASLPQCFATKRN